MLHAYVIVCDDDQQQEEDTLFFSKYGSCMLCIPAINLSQKREMIWTGCSNLFPKKYFGNPARVRSIAECCNR